MVSEAEEPNLQEEGQRYSLLPSGRLGVLPHVVLAQRLLPGVSATQRQTQCSRVSCEVCRQTEAENLSDMLFCLKTQAGRGAGKNSSFVFSGGLVGRRF